MPPIRSFAPPPSHGFVATVAPPPGSATEALASYPMRRCRKGVHLIGQGHPAQDVFLVRSGLVKLCQTSANGRTAIVGLRQRDSLLGVGPALLRTTHPVTVVTVTPCTVTRIPASEFVGLVRSSPEVSWLVHLAHCHELERELSLAGGLACLSSRERLEEFLRLLREELAPAANGAGIEVPVKSWELAQILAVTPQWLCQLVQELRDEGVLARRGNQWIYLPEAAD